MTNITALVKLVADFEDVGGYITYVFECLEDYMIAQTKYLMVTRFPNWDFRSLKVGEIGYLHAIEVIAGEDEYFNKMEKVPYNYTAIHFIKFIEKPEDKEKENDKFTM